MTHWDEKKTGATPGADGLRTMQLVLYKAPTPSFPVCMQSCLHMPTPGLTSRSCQCAQADNQCGMRAALAGKARDTLRGILGKPPLPAPLAMD